jgi:hypothetical protein
MEEVEHYGWGRVPCGWFTIHYMGILKKVWSIANSEDDDVCFIIWCIIKFGVNLI